MKQFLLGAAFLMFISSLPADATNDHTIALEPPVQAQKVVYMQAFAETLPPIGYVTFCREHEPDCRYSGPFADLMQLTPDKVAALEQVNSFVNTTISPVTDLELYGKVEYWAYPKDKGDCEDYVLLKRKMLLQAGWPRQALLITVVRDRNGDGHAVLTVKTDKGEFILDNQNPEILLWSETGYHFVKRQSQTDPNTWVSLGDPFPAIATASSH